MAVSTSGLETMVGDLLFISGLCHQTDIPLLKLYDHCRLEHSDDQTSACRIQCADCSHWFPCKAFFMLPFLHKPNCRMCTDESARSVYSTLYRCDMCANSFRGRWGIDAHTQQSACHSPRECRLCDLKCYGDSYKNGELKHNYKKRRIVRYRV